MNSPRPKNLNLFTIRFPLPAIVSILHRITGVLLFILTPISLGILHYSLQSQANFDHLHAFFHLPLMKILLLLALMPLIFHFTAGIRHLLMDMNLGVELRSGKLTGILTLLISLLLTILAGYYIW